MASSVELGPGMTLAAPSRSRNCSRVSHWRRRTVLLSVGAATGARAEDKPDSGPAADAQTATRYEATAATPAPADEAAPAEAAEPAAAAKVEDAASEAKPGESAPAPAEPARVEMAEPEKAPAAKA